MKSSFKVKLLAPIIVIIIVFSAIMTFVPSYRMFGFNNDKTKERIQFYFACLEKEIQENLDWTFMAALNLSQNSALAENVLNEDINGIIAVLLDQLQLYHIDYCTVTDKDGTVLARTYSPGTYGDSILDQLNVQKALAGQVCSYYESGTEVKVSARGGAPIYDGQGNIIGALSVGIRLDQAAFVDQLKERFGVESSVIFEDTRVSTTIIHDGTRAVGTKVDWNIKEMFGSNGAGGIVQQEGYTLWDVEYFSVFHPILNGEGEPFAAIFMGIDNNLASAYVNKLVREIILISFIVLVISVIVLIFAANSIARPIGVLSNGLKQLANGTLIEDLNIHSRDEIGELADSVYSVSNTIRSLNDEIDQAIRRYQAGRLMLDLPVEKLAGCYKEIGENINEMCMEMKEDIFDLLHCMEGFSQGNFDVDIKKMPGERAIANKMIDEMRMNLRSVSQEIKILTSAALAGNLSMSADSSRYNGNWKEIIEDLNELLERITSPFEELTSAIMELSKGNTTVRIKKELKGDYTNIKDSFNSTIGSLSSYIHEIRYTLNEMAGNNFQVSIDREYIGDFDEIKSSVNSVIATFNRILKDIYLSTEAFSSSSEQILESSIMLATGASEQSTAVESLEKSIGAISTSIHEIAQRANQVEELTVNTSETAKRGKGKMHSMVEAMDKILEEAKNINAIMKVIDDIAFKTNLLALNASVEAARAGAAGKGFAIVADEVRQLANKSQQSAKEIADLIESTNNRIAEGVILVSETSAELDKVEEEIGFITGIIQSIAESTAQQAENIQLNSKSLTKISKVTISNLTASEETTTAIQKLTEQAESFQRMASQFKLK